MNKTITLTREEQIAWILKVAEYGSVLPLEPITEEMLKGLSDEKLFEHWEFCERHGINCN